MNSRVESFPLLARALSNPIFRNVLILASGTIVAQAINVGSVVVLARLYSPETMGLFGVFQSFFSLTSFAVLLRFDMALVPIRSRKEAAQIYVFCLWLSVPVALLFSAFFAGLRQAHWFGFEKLDHRAVYLVFGLLLATSLQTGLRALALRRGHFQALTRVALGQALGRALVQIGTGLLGFGWTGLAWGEVVGRGLGGRRLFRLGWLTYLRGRVGFRLSTALKIWREKKNFALLNLPACLLEGLYVMLPFAFVAKFYGAREAGFFLLAQRVWCLPVVIVSNSTADVFFSQMSRLQGDPVGAARLFRTVLFKIVAVGLGGSLVAFLISKPLATLVLGPEWTRVGELVRVLTPWYLGEFISIPVSRVCEVYGKQRLKLYASGSVTLLCVLVFGVAQYADWELTPTLLVASFSFLVAFSLAIGAFWRGLRTAHNS